jgi:hypothetical protein
MDDINLNFFLLSPTFTIRRGGFSLLRHRQLFRVFFCFPEHYANTTTEKKKRQNRRITRAKKRAKMIMAYDVREQKKWLAKE